MANVQFRHLDNFSQIWQIVGYAMEKSDKSMDLLKFMKSEDFSGFQECQEC